MREWKTEEIPVVFRLILLILGLAAAGECEGKDYYNGQGEGWFYEFAQFQQLPVGSLEGLPKEFNFQIIKDGEFITDMSRFHRILEANGFNPNGPESGPIVRIVLATAKKGQDRELKMKGGPYDREPLVHKEFSVMYVLYREARYSGEPVLDRALLTFPPGGLYKGVFTYVAPWSDKVSDLYNLEEKAKTAALINRTQYFTGCAIEDNP